MNKSNVELYIEELVLQSRTGNPERLRTAVERELTRMFVERGLPAALQLGCNRAVLEGGSVQISGGTVEAIAAQVARQVYDGLEES